MCRVQAHAGQRGQAMVEMVAMGGVTSLLFLGIWYLGKYHDIQASTIQAARYTAWERTVHAPSDMSDARIEQQTRARLFTFNHDAYKATDSQANGASWGSQSPNWNDHSASKRLVERPDDVRVSMRVEGFPGKAAAAISSTLGAITLFTGALTGGAPLPQGGLTTGTVTVALNNVASLPAPLDALNLTLTESASLATNSWDANGPQQVAARVKPFAPVSGLTSISALLAPVTSGLSLIEPAFRDFLPGQICPDIVPADRVQGNSVLPAYAGAQQCIQ